MDIAYMKTNRDTTNDSNLGNVDFIQENPEIAIPYLILISAFALGGTIGNGMVIASVLTYKPLRTIGNIFVVNLALADFSLTSFVDPFSIVGIIKGEIWFENHAILCSIIGIICLESCFCSLLSIMVISIDRYVHICKNQKYRDIFTKRRAIMICIGIWILCLILQIPSRFGWIDYKYDLKNLGCVADRTHPSPYYYIAYATAVTLPTTAIIWCYFQIFSYARKCKKMVKNVSKNGSSEKDNSLQLAKTLCIIFIVFATCWTPYTTLAIADRGDVLPLPVHLFGILIAHMNSSVNCLIYGLTNKQFSIAYKKLLGLDKRGKNKSMKSKMHSETSTSTSTSTSDTSISHI